MITAVDTSVLVDVFWADDRFGIQSRERLDAAYRAGAILVCDIVYAELVPRFAERPALDAALRAINATLSPVDTAIAWEGATTWPICSYSVLTATESRVIANKLTS